MKKSIFILLMFCAFTSKAQNLILNGSFEQNIVTGCEMDEFSNHFNDSISYITLYDYHMQIIKDSCLFCPPYYWGGGAQEGHWFIGIAARTFNFPQGLVWKRSKFSMDLSMPLSANKNYKLSFYIKKPPPPPDIMCNDVGNSSITVGISNIPTQSGTFIYQSPLGADDWQQYSVVFNTTNAEQYITVEIDSGATTNNTLFIDNFVLEETTEHITTWHCINNSCVDTANGSGTYTSLAACIDDCSLPPTSINENNVQKQLVKIIDILGRETQPKKNTPLFYLYDDGTVEKKIFVE